MMKAVRPDKDENFKRKKGKPFQMTKIEWIYWDSKRYPHRYEEVGNLDYYVESDEEEEMSSNDDYQVRREEINLWRKK